MDDLNLLQLKANDGKAYKFATAKIQNTRDVLISFKTQQLAMLHIQKFTHLEARRGADLLAVLGLLDFPAEMRARSIGPEGIPSAYNVLARAIFESKLWVYEVPSIDPVIVQPPNIVETVLRTTSQMGSKGGKDKKAPKGKDSISVSPRRISPDEMELSGDPVSMLTGEEILGLSDFVLDGRVALSWFRQYRSSLCDQNIGLGFGWRSNFHFELSKITSEGTEQWMFVDQHGDILHFDDVAPGAVCYQVAAGASFSHDTRGRYLVVLSDGRQIRFVYQHQRWVADRLRLSELERYHLAYSTAGRLITVTANGGRQIELRYDAGGYLVEVKGKGAVYHEPVILASYQYDLQGDLIAATNRQQQIEHYCYDGHVLLQRQRPSGLAIILNGLEKGQNQSVFSSGGTTATTAIALSMMRKAGLLSVPTAWGISGAMSTPLRGC